MNEIADRDIPEGLELMEHYEKSLLDLEDCKDIPAANLVHDGVLLRVVDMEAGKYVCGHEHVTSHFNIVLSGKAIVSMNGLTSKVGAGDIFLSDPGCRKGLFIVEDMRWVTVHPNPDNLEDDEELHNRFVKRSEAYYNRMDKQIEGGKECLGE